RVFLALEPVEVPHAALCHFVGAGPRLRQDAHTMREWRSRWSVLAVLLLFAIWPTIADAAARVVVPSGWGESAAAAPEALRRANRWQSALGLRLAQVVSAPEGDRFAETVAVFERSQPVPEDAFA